MIQSDIAERVAKVLEVKVLGEERQRLEGRASKNAEALILYMKGRSSFNEGTEPGVRKAIEYFEGAVQQDSGFALGYVGLADCYYSLDVEVLEEYREYIAKAKKNLDKAIALNSDLGEAHASLGLWLRNELRWEEAEIELKKALALSPSYALAHSRYASLLCCVGKLDEALYEARKAQELDPLSLRGAFTVGQVLYYRREYDQAIEQWKQILRIKPNDAGTLMWLGFAYKAKSMMEEALRMVSKFYEQAGDDPSSPGFNKFILAAAYVWASRKEEAKAIQKEAERDPKLPPASFAYWHTFLGNIDLAFEFLEKACEARDSLLYSIKVEPFWDPLRSDPRFAILLQKLRLA